MDGAESAEEAAFAVNGTGAGNLAAGAREVDAAVVFVSTDYVFDGQKGSPYVESDQPAPQSAYGRTKLAGEEATAAANKRHFIVRSAGLFGINGGNFVDTKLRLAESTNEVLVVRDQVTSPTYTWHEFAREIFEQAKTETKVLSGTTEMLGRPAPRPAFSALQSQREHAIRLPSWHDGLAGYLAQRESETN